MSPIYPSQLLNEDWQTIESFLPNEWEDIGEQKKALRRKRKDGFGNLRSLLKTLLLHAGKGYSLKETSVRVKRSGIADVSNVSIMNSLQNSEEWLKELCIKLHKESSDTKLPRLASNMEMKMIDGTIIKEPGKTGSQWRIHYGISLPNFSCNHFLLTSSKGKGNGESIDKYPAQKGDCFMADRGYSRFKDIDYVVNNEADIIVRVHYRMLIFVNYNNPDQKFDLISELSSLSHPGKTKEWPVFVKDDSTGKLIKGRLCAIKKSKEQIDKATRRVKAKASKNGRITVEKKALEYAKYIVIFTTIDDSVYSTQEILDWYRVRWQIELTFKRFKSLANLGHLPKYNDKSSRAWLYSKLLICLLTEKMVRIASSFSPWGYY
jgi:hypothetical protein